MHEPQQLRNFPICVFLREICVLFAGKLSTCLLNSEQFWNFMGTFLAKKKIGLLIIFTNSEKSSLFQRL